jgi:hypothetical protein
VEGRQHILLAAQVRSFEEGSKNLQPLRRLSGEEVDLVVDTPGIEATEAQVGDAVSEVGLEAEFQVRSVVALQYAQGARAQFGRQAVVELHTLGGGYVDALVHFRGSVAGGRHEVGQHV